jgi:hypothetical protein
MRCPNCKQAEVSTGNRCSYCQDLCTPDECWNEREVVFTNCNVCGRTLHTTDEEEMGMCQICADE